MKVSSEKKKLQTHVFVDLTNFNSVCIGNIGDTVMEVDDDTKSFTHSRLITGDGLRCMAGVTPHKVHEELSSIHRENTQRLAAMTEQELLEEKEKMEKTLGKLKEKKI